MTLSRFFTSAVALAATVAAVPAGRKVVERQNDEITSTVTLTTVSTFTQHVATATPIPSGNPGQDTNQNGTDLAGVAYAPYRADHQCKTSAQIKDDFTHLAGSYSLVRIYGTDCDQVPAVYECAKDSDMKVFLGIWDIDSVASEAQKIIDGINGDWDIVHTVSVGNELVNNGAATPEKVLGAVSQARGILRKAGYKGPVVTVDTFVAAGAYPQLCDESDYCAVNAHAFFDPTSSADEAGEWLERTVASLKAKLQKDQRVVICESGWPNKGSINGLAVPGLEEQKKAIAALKDAFADHMEDLILFSAFNDPWKKEAAWSFNAEPYWGISGAVSSSDS